MPPTGNHDHGPLGAMPPRRTEDDLQVEARIRAHLKQRMSRRGIGNNEAARLLDYDPGYLSRFLNGHRGVSAVFVYRVCRVFGIDPDILLNVDLPAPAAKTSKRSAS